VEWKLWAFVEARQSTNRPSSSTSRVLWPTRLRISALEPTHDCAIRHTGDSQGFSPRIRRVLRVDTSASKDAVRRVSGQRTVADIRSQYRLVRAQYPHGRTRLIREPEALAVSGNRISFVRFQCRYRKPRRAPHREIVELGRPVRDAGPQRRPYPLHSLHASSVCASAGSQAAQTISQVRRLAGVHPPGQ